MKLIIPRDEINPNPSKVGQAAYDILSKPQPLQEVGETIDMITPDYLDELKKTVEENRSKYNPPFYVLVLGKKEFYAINVVRHWFVARQTCPLSSDLMRDYKNFFHEVYKYDDRTGDCVLLWVLPAIWTHEEILNHWETYDPQLVAWLWDHYQGKLGLDQQQAEQPKFVKV